MEQHSNKIDILRFVSIIAVTTIHCSASINRFAVQPDANWWLGDFYDSVSRFCVPVFVMVSGSLILPKTYSLAEFIKKRFSRIIPPFAFWTVVYILFNCVDQGLFKSIYVIKFIALSILNGAFFHLWFVYMIIGIYLIAPIIGKWIKHATETEILYFLALWFIALILNMPVIDRLSIKSVFINFPAYLGYFVLGYYLQIKDLKWKNVKLIAFAVFLTGFFLTFFGVYFFSRHDKALNISMLDFTTVNVCLMAIGIFIFIKNMKFKLPRIAGSCISFISAYSFGIYLLHPLVIIFLERINIHYASTAPLLGVPLTVLAVLVLSALLLRIMRMLPFGNYITGVN
jgi:surface polysaccharide O-acyltransferase-like enzyme